MNVFLICFINGLFKEYRWLLDEYNKSWNNPLKYSELTPKEVKLIINKYESELHLNKTRKLNFEKVQKVQNILDKRLKKYQSNTYSEFNRYGNLSEFRFYQFVVAYKKGLENYYKEIILS